MKNFLGLVAAAAMATGCQSDANEAMRKDAYGNYASTATYNAMERADFAAAMKSGLRDFDAHLASLKLEADKLGPDAVKEYHGSLDGLMEGRRKFAAELERHDAMLADDWRGNREHVAEMYVDLREELDDAYKNVVDEA